MKLIYDDKIPLINKLLPSQGIECYALATQDFTASAIKNADAIVVRSQTRVDKSLLMGSKVSMVMSPTSGISHIDKDYLEQHNIKLINAPGCNARSVAEYVLILISYLHELRRLKGNKAGIIGVGHVGKQTHKLLTLLGFDCFLYDPPRALRETAFESCDKEILFDCDIIILHTALTKYGSHPSFHMLDEDFFEHLKEGCIILNAARGEIIKDSCLLGYKDKFTFCLDVFSNEPFIDPQHVNAAFIATPHIAGHAIEAKIRASYQVCQNLLSSTFTCFDSDAKLQYSPITAHFRGLQELIRSIYDPMKDTEAMKKIITKQDKVLEFFNLRKQHNYRHEFSHLCLKKATFEGDDIHKLKKLGFRC